MSSYLKVTLGGVSELARNALIAFSVDRKTFEVGHILYTAGEDTFTVNLDARDREGARDIAEILPLVFPTVDTPVIVDGETIGPDTHKTLRKRRRDLPAILGTALMIVWVVGSLATIAIATLL